MAHIFTMPMLGSTMEEGTILRWLKQEGDLVKSGEAIVEVMTDKASIEVESSADGVLRKIIAGPDITVAVRQPIAIIGTATEAIDGLQMNGSSAVPAAVAPAPASGGRPIRTAASIAVSPRARRLADEADISLETLRGRGTGPAGRIIERDVQALLNGLGTAKDAGAAGGREKALPESLANVAGANLAELAAGLPGSAMRGDEIRDLIESRASNPVTTSGDGFSEYTVRPLSGLRKTIATNVAKSAFTAPHVTLTLEVDMGSAVELRSRLLPEIEKSYGVRLSYTELIVKAAARALEDYPDANSALLGDEIRTYRRKHIGVAVALESGLSAPVLRDADQKSLGQICAELKALVGRARAGSSTQEDLSGGTFTVTNLGAYEIDLFDPIIVAPQAAILGIGRLAEKPAVREGKLVIRPLMNLCLSFDHRVLDGAPAAKFLQRVKQLLENPAAILI